MLVSFGHDPPINHVCETVFTSPLKPEAPDTLQLVCWLGAKSSESDAAATCIQWSIIHGPRFKTQRINLRKPKPWTNVSTTRLKKSLINPKCENKDLCHSLWPSVQSLLLISLMSALKGSMQPSKQAQPCWCQDMDKLVTNQLTLDSVFHISICMSAQAANLTCQRLEGLILLPDSAWIHSKRSLSD